MHQYSLQPNHILRSQKQPGWALESLRCVIILVIRMQSCDICTNALKSKLDYEASSDSRHWIDLKNPGPLHSMFVYIV